MTDLTLELPDEAWVQLLGKDPRSWLLASDEPSAHYITLTQLLDLPVDHPAVHQTHAAVLDAFGTRELIKRLPNWESNLSLSGHNSPAFAPNLLNLLADIGVLGGDDPKIEHLLDTMLAHQEENGWFLSYGTSRASPEPAWSALLCDTHAITEVLVRFGRANDPRTRAALARIIADIADTAQGPAWLCVPNTISGFRGPGRKADFCPQVTLAAIRTFAHLPAEDRPAVLLKVARTSLRAWQMRSAEKPYMFGHGYQFKTTKWPMFWYDISSVLATLGRYPELWQGPEALSEDRKALAELAACLIAYNFDLDGTVTPRSAYKGFESYSFGQKKKSSPLATAFLISILRRFDDLTDDILAIDVLKLSSSKGGTGTPKPPGKRKPKET